MAKNQGKTSSNQASPSKQEPKATPATVQRPPVVSNPPLKTTTTYSKPGARPQNAAKMAPQADLVFGKRNYLIMIGGLLVIALGFFLMAGTTDIMSNTKIVLAPIIVLSGFALEFYAILAKPLKSV